AVVRSVHRVSETRHVACAEPLVYRLDSEEKRESLLYFLHYLFRKEEFREGQIGILERALARKDVIGLLPTGAGKSLCYQLSALLQPGITLVVDPIKSLMHDQDDHLREAGIDTTTFIDSSLKGVEKRKRIKSFQDGEFLFAFVSPERLMIQEFRDALTNMRTASSPKWFSYCVIDEAHCVSEWGHDFRPAYLRLGENARKFCKPASNALPFIALTGTASFDVLSDVQRELELEDDEAIVTLGTYEREELQFEIIRVPEPQDLPTDKKNDWEAPATQKKLYLTNWLRKLPRRFGHNDDEDYLFYEPNGEETNSGLVFCPHVGGPFGIHEVAKYLKENIPRMTDSVSKYGGEKTEGVEVEDLEETQRRFRKNDLVLLVATKSFGMGIDKPNIRYTLHFNMPQSLEAFYQEAGRAGRDRKKAVCGLFLSKKFSDKKLMQSFIDDAFRGEDKEKRVIYELLNSIEPSHGSVPGIERMLEDMDVSQTEKLTIPLENKRMKEIARYTRKDIEKVRKAYKFCYKVEKFAGKLWVSVHDDLKRDFEHIRTESETFKAIYRLSVVGAIEDYTVDYSKRLIKATITKHADDGYVKMLSQYVSKYMSKEEAKRVPEEIAQRKGKTVLQKCLGYLMSFVYERIKKRREEALNVMEQAAKVGAYPNDNPEKDKDACQRDFSGFVYSYFDSRYTPELRKSLYEYDIDLVWRYIDEVKGEPGSTRHLRGSCDRLLVENPDNAALLLLRAYARIILAYSKEDVIRDLRRGFKLFKVKIGYSSTVKAASRCYREVERQGDQMLPAIQGEMIKLHLDWLREFNSRFEGE
ncbi:ATP-dependent DNA helicase RecQ, partial [Candidatus Bipolaricaulota bacterium]|nr:ATP-dependent DNA helicase RecQ [Candidatus Bipolaricaulota bacterium]